MRTAEAILTETARQYADKPFPECLDWQLEAMKQYAAEAVEEQVKLCAQAAWQRWPDTVLQEEINNCQRVELR